MEVAEGLSMIAHAIVQPKIVRSQFISGKGIVLALFS